MLLTVQQFFNSYVFNNTWLQWSTLAGVILLVILFKKYISKLISLLLFRLVKRTDAGELTEEFLHLILKPLQYLIVLQTIYFGFKTLHYPFIAEDEVIQSYAQVIVLGLYRFLFILNVAWLIARLGDFFVAVLDHRAKKTEDPWDDQLVVFLRDIIRVTVYIIAFLSVLGLVFGVNIYSLVAGAGIAGIAIAFAAQETLQNLFGSVSIFTEKPFVIGDLIEVDGITGKVVRVGFRSTRIKTTDTSFMTVPNKNIVNNKLSNLTRRSSRRIQFNLGLTYQTEQTQIRKIIEEIRNYGNTHPKMNEEVNVGLFNFTSFAIEIYVEFYMEYEVWDKYILTRDEIMFKIMEIVKQNNAVFAYQVQFMNLEKN